MVEEATEADDPVLTQLVVVGSNISSLVTQAEGPIKTNMSDMWQVWTFFGSLLQQILSELSSSRESSQCLDDSQDL